MSFLSMFSPATINVIYGKKFHIRLTTTLAELATIFIHYECFNSVAIGFLDSIVVAGMKFSPTSHTICVTHKSLV